jgi:hypothetical protein
MAAAGMGWAPVGIAGGSYATPLRRSHGRQIGPPTVLLRNLGSRDLVEQEIMVGD